VRTFSPTFRKVVTYEPNTEPVGTDMVERIDALYGLAALGVYNLGPPAFGPSGDPTRTFSGDLGPQQGGFKGKLLSAGARNAVAKGDRTGLPVGKVPSQDLIDAPGWSAQAQFGVR
jgi:hypothetical protein